jgi:tetratricopeptide (TPR) repeat protein
VAAVSTREREDVRRDLNELVHREFVRPVRVSAIEGEEEFSFWHALVRDVAYQQIPRSPRAEKHVAAAVWVERTAEERVADHAEILVHHYGEALDLTAAAGLDTHEIAGGLVRFLLLAGERASQLDTSAAEAYYRRAVDLAGGDEHALAMARSGLAEILVHRGRFAESVELYELAIESFRSLDELAAGRTLNQLATLAWNMGDVARSERLALEAVAILERLPAGPELVHVYGSEALRCAIAGRFAAATPLVEKGLALARELGTEDVTVLSNARASIAGYQGDPVALDHLREAIELGLRLGLGRSTSVAMNNLGDGLAYFVGMREALGQWDDAIAFSRARGLRDPEMWQRGERLRALYHLGEWDELQREAGEILGWEEQTGGGQLGVMVRADLAHVLVHGDAVADAQRHVDALLPKARESGDPQVLVPGLTTAALVAAAHGDDARALEQVAELEELTRAMPTFRDYCLVWPSRIAVAAGDPTLAAAFLDGPEHASAWNACARLTGRAMVAEAKGRPDEAASLYRDAAERWDAYGSVVERGYALLGLGRCGDAAAMREARATFARLGASPVVALAA